MEITTLSCEFYSGENNSRQILISVPTELAEKNISLSFITPRGFHLNSGAIDIDETGHGSYYLTSQILDDEGQLAVQVVVTDGNGFDQKSKIKYFRVGDEISGVTVIEESVKYVPQLNKTESQKMIARQNIGAMPADTPIPSKVSDIENDSDYQTGSEVAEAISDATEDVVRTTAQSLSEQQKSQARANIGADTDGLAARIDSISSGTRNINTAEIGRYSVSESTGVITHNDSSTTTFGISEKIRCEANTQYSATFYGIGGSEKVAIYYVSYNEDGEYISGGHVYNVKVTDSIASTRITTSEGAAFIAVSAYASPLNITNAKIQIEIGERTEYIDPFTAFDRVARDGADVANKSLNADINVNYFPGYFASNGTISPPSATNQEKYTNSINAKFYKKINWSVTYPTSQAGWGAMLTIADDGTVTRTILFNATGTSFDGSVEISSTTKEIAFCLRTFGTTVFELTGIANVGNLVNEVGKRDNGLAFPLRFKPFYDHLFIDKIFGSAVIPSESLFNIAVSKRLGFDVIEANVQRTSDDEYIVMHGVSGKFGKQVVHKDGDDIENTLINSVSLDWIKENVRYESDYEKYRVAPPSIQEFLYECKRLNMIPMITCNTQDLADIIDGIMGKDNYIAYKGTRSITGAPILTFESKTTKTEILAESEKYGVPYMYCMSNPTDFTDEELIDIVNDIHKNGYWIGIAGCYQSEAEWQRVKAIGFDFAASGWAVNDFDSGNICNLSGDVDFSDYATTGTISGEKIALAEDQQIVPAETLDEVFLGKSVLRIRFNGTLSVRMGHIREDIISDGSHELIFSTYYLESAPTFRVFVPVGESAEVYEINFRASKC